MASIWRENTLRDLSLDVISSSQLRFLQPSLSENCSLFGTDNVRGQTSQHIFAPNGGCCLNKSMKTLELHYPMFQFLTYFEWERMKIE